MNTLFKIILFFTFSATVVDAQVILNLNVVTKSKKPVQYAIIKHETSVENANQLGFIRITNYKYGSKITISKLGFVDTTIAFNAITNKDTLTAYIILQSKIILLDEVPVYSNKAREINPLKSNFILDYELYEDRMVELLSNNNLLLLNAENNNIWNKKVPKGSENIAKDFYGVLNLTTSAFAYKIKVDELNLLVDTSRIALDNFNRAIKYCDGVLDTFSFVRRYKDINQTVAFFAISTTNSKHFKLLKEVCNEDKKRVVKSHAGTVNYLMMVIDDPENPAGEMGRIDAAELELRRNIERLMMDQKAIFDTPPYNTLKLIKDSVYIFAHDIDTLFVYDKACHLVRRNYINYHHLKYWGAEVIVNEEKTKAYGKFVSNKHVMVAEINLSTGQLKLPFFKIESNLPKKIKIRGNTIYYLGKQSDGVGYNVYAQNLQL